MKDHIKHVISKLGDIELAVTNEPPSVILATIRTGERVQFVIPSTDPSKLPSDVALKLEGLRQGL